MAATPSPLVRRAFLDFFAHRGHHVVASAPLLPQNDPTLMFVNAGMVQFKDVFTGKDTRPYARAASSQKCIRISGKHNDLENVGVTARHQTFFEMLGNFSFGDYFKEEAIAYAWELLTKTFEIPEEKLVITVFQGEGGFGPDDEARALWKKTTGFGDDRVIGLGLKDNFWQMGETGPCGPCTEIHFWNGAGEPDLSKFLDEPPPDGKGWTEIWNLVFMQYERFLGDDGAIAQRPLPKPCVDTGMGLERVSCVLQGVTSNYDTDLLRPLVDKAAVLANKPYRGSMADDDVSMRVIADHARTTAFLIAEGVTPDKQKREYVLRRVMRRAIRHGHRLGIERPFLHEVALAVVESMGEAYPELVERRDMIARVTEDEEVRFRATLKRGMKIIEEIFADLRSTGERSLGVAVAADLYTTYGFPLDLTQVIAAEAGFELDVAGAEGIVHMAEGADGPIDPSAAVDAGHREARDKLAEPVRFTGYEREEGEAAIVALLKVTNEGGKPRRTLVERVEAGSEVEIVVAETPFYAESGGQVGDVGRITGDGFRVDVTDTTKPFAGLVTHVGVVREGSVSVGARAKLEVDHAARSATRRNHSATHLLHWALRKVLGEHAQQKGSRVGPDVLRFDFSSNRALTSEERARVEDLVNAKVLTNAKVTTEILSMDEAKKRGAMAIFEEKYGSTVRMLTMTPEVVELCGGTHARALGDIGLFKLTSEAGVAAGVRRLFAVTGLNALAYVRDAEAELGRARQAAKAQGGDLVDKIQKLAQHERELEKKVAKLERDLIGASASGGAPTLAGGNGAPAAAASGGLTDRARTIGDLTVLAERVADGTNAGVLRDTAEQWRDKLGDRSVVLLAANAGGKAQLCVMVSKAATDKVKAGDLVKVIAKIVGGSGGGRPDMAQAGGTDVTKIDEAITATYEEVERLVSRAVP